MRRDALFKKVWVVIRRNEKSEKKIKKLKKNKKSEKITKNAKLALIRKKTHHSNNKKKEQAQSFSINRFYFEIIVFEYSFFIRSVCSSKSKYIVAENLAFQRFESPFVQTTNAFTA